MKRSDCILVYGSTTKGGVVKRSDCILVYGSTTKGDVVKRSDCTLRSVWEHCQGWCCEEVQLWCLYVLICCRDLCTVYGGQVKTAFSQLPSVIKMLERGNKSSIDRTQSLCSWALSKIRPKK